MGCEHCQSTPARRDDLPLKVRRVLYDRSHHSFCLWECVDCGQVFLGEFREHVDWTGRWGKDQMWDRWTPLTPDEVSRIEQEYSGDNLTPQDLSLLSALSARRRHLTENPDGEFYWTDSPFDATDILPPG